MSNRMRILVTGGTGFAGRFIADYLAEKGYNTTATYRHGDPVDPKGRITYVKQELSKPILLKETFDAIVHTACSHSGGGVRAEEYVRDNIDSARELVAFAKKRRIPTIIYFSTRSVYGEIRESEADESADIINPDPYGLTKYLAEKIFQEAEGIQSIGFRTPGIIGPGAHDIWLVDLVNRICRGEDIIVNDFDTKNLVYIGDVARFIEKLLLEAERGKSFKYSIVNLGCSESINNSEIAEAVKKRVHSNSGIEMKKPQNGLFVINSDKAQEMGFQSSAPIEIVNHYLDSIIKNIEG